MTIPLTLHQTWINEDIPEHWKKSPIEWKRFHPDWEYILWTDEMNRNLIETKYPKLLDLYDSFEFPIQRADMIRYCILDTYGGIYSDLDIYPSENIEKYLSGDCEAFFVMSSNSKVFTNNFMASIPKAGIWNHVLRDIKKDSKWYHIGKHLKVYNTTGPNFLNGHILKNENTIGMLPINKFHAYSIHEQDSNGGVTQIKETAVIHPLPGRSWCGWDTRVYNFFYENSYFFFSMGILACFIAIVLVAILITKYFRIKVSSKKNFIYFR